MLADQYNAKQDILLTDKIAFSRMILEEVRGFKACEVPFANRERTMAQLQTIRNDNGLFTVVKSS